MCVEKGSEMTLWVWSIGVLSYIYQELHTTFPMHTEEVDMLIFLGECRMGPRCVGRCKGFVEFSQHCIIHDVTTAQPLTFTKI